MQYGTAASDYGGFDRFHGLQVWPADELVVIVGLDGLEVIAPERCSGGA